MENYLKDSINSLLEFEETAENRIKILSSYKSQEESKSHINMVEDHEVIDEIANRGRVIQKRNQAFEDLYNLMKVLEQGLDQIDEYDEELQKMDYSVKDELKVRRAMHSELPTPNELDAVEEIYERVVRTEEELMDMDISFYEWSALNQPELVGYDDSEVAREVIRNDYSVSPEFVQDQEVYELRDRARKKAKTM